MTATPLIQVDELVVPGTSAADGVAVAAAFRQELHALWANDRAAGRDWARVDAVTLEIDPTQSADRLGAAIARAVRSHAVAEPGGEKVR